MESIHEIDSIKDADSTRKLHLLAFCILVMLDGESVCVPPFSVRPIDEEGTEGDDISGNLHDNFNKIKSGT